MKTFLSAETIAASMQRLIDSRARDGLVHFLLFKRAITKAKANDVPFSSNDPNFTGAMRDLAATYPPNIGLKAPPNISPFVKVFGTAGASKYVTSRWTTNGPADTLSGPKWSSVVHLEKTRPRRGSLNKDYIQHLGPLLLKTGQLLPALADAAIWYHRANDLQELLGSSHDSDQLIKKLCDAFIKELNLTGEEIALLFDASAQPVTGHSLTDMLREEVADPQTYLPDLGGGSGNLAEMLYSFESLAISDSVGMHLANLQLLPFAAALGAKRFLILGGLAGSGKTKLAQAFAHWLTPPPVDEHTPNPYYALVPVGADWTSNENILGYPDGLDSKRYVSRPALELMLHAEQHFDAPHFLILDEMNLSHVERYFADLLSAIESGEAIPLYDAPLDDKSQWRVANASTPVPPRLKLPANVFVIGTVNVDETTYLFSPKVLDRANVLEFRMEESDLAAFLANPQKPDVAELDGQGEAFGAAFVEAAKERVVAPADVQALYEAEIKLFFGILRDHGAEFGYRVAHEAVRFLHFYKLLGGYVEGDLAWFNAAFDAIVVQKFLPKLHGSRSRLEGLLWALAQACGPQRGGETPEQTLARCRAAGKAQDDAQYGLTVVEKNTPALYPLSFDKVLRMWRKLARDQFASFAEA